MKKGSFLYGIVALLIFISFGKTYAKGWTEVDGIWFYQNVDGSFVTETIITSGEDKFYVNAEGAMARDVLLEDYNGNTYYFGSNGAMIRNSWVSVDPTAVIDSSDNPPGAYYYYFGGTGAAYRAKNNGILKKTIDGQKYLFDEHAHRLWGWVDETGAVINDFEEPFKDAVYYCGDEYDGVMRTGWVQFDGGTYDDEYKDYSIVWLYFDANSGKKISPAGTGETEKTKKISGQSYLFDQYGVMKHGWQNVKKDDDNIYAGKFYSEDTEGNLKKKSWLYTVPPEEFLPNSGPDAVDDYATDTKRWFYSDNSGNIVVNKMKKVNSHYYVFDKKGIMRCGLVVWDTVANEYKYTIDTERTESRDLIVRRRGSGDPDDASSKAFLIDTDGNARFFEVRDYTDIVDPEHPTYKSDKLYYFFKDTDEGKKEGVRADKQIVKLTFSDGDFNFAADSNGNISGYKPTSRKYYDAGFLLQAQPDIGYGLVVDNQQAIDYTNPAYSHIKPGEKEFRTIQYNNNNTTYRPKLYIVDTNGVKLTKRNYVKKDKLGNYWVTDNAGRFMKIFTVFVKYGARPNNFPSVYYPSVPAQCWQFKSDYKDPYNNDRVKNCFIPFSDYCDPVSDPLSEQFNDVFGYTVSTKRADKNYEIIPPDIGDHEYALNFYWGAADSVYPPAD